MRRRGTTLVELMLVVALTALVVGALASMYAFTMSRINDTGAVYYGTDQAKRVADKIDETVRNAVSCSTVNSGGHIGLKCVMPAQGTDTDGDGYLDRYWPYHVTRRGVEQYGTGKRVWFYQADSTGAFGTAGNYFWRAQRNDDSNPVAANADTTLCLYYGGSPVFDLVDTLTFSVDSANKLVTFTVSTLVYTRDRRRPGSPVPSAETRATTDSRTIFWRNWRQ